MNYQYATIDGLRIRYVDSKTEGQTVLLIHGLGGSADSWTNNVDAISKKVRAIAIDLPGFGFSDKPKINYTIKFYSEFIVKFLKHLQINHVSIVGSSLGGHVAAQLAMGHPDLVSKLVLISPAGALPVSFTGTPALRKYVRVLHAESLQEVRKALTSVDSIPVDDTYAQAVYQWLSMPGAKEAFLSAFKGSAKAPRLSKHLHKIKADTLLLWGKEDRMIPVKFIEPFVKMKNCRIVLLEKCGHRPHVDRPELFNKIVTDFVSG